jgi:uncharacterized membrane protein
MRVAAGAYVAALVTLCAVDGVWLTAMLGTYRRALGDLLAATPAFVPAALFYLLYAVGVVALVVLPSVTERQRSLVTARGAVFGLVAYGTYDLTNQATLRDWPAWLTMLDMAWGTVLTAVAATLAHALASRLARREASRA